ncbi:uncharacterized protein BT62DRAFT_1009249 [Guyanagaster necrorhizus]|uniref:Uncharacterized protein n=1 Tax=Guyanagaster necrorhizus TaxID=856835 RepID=A0A9P8AQ40_9AGAR|nr:uncharacterized protein BT62DRAFT_1009249 [Guyanagaster necrorhizus MCA 3950]KAG7443436.1 hypothetical protein BT62DRAFT_1009249 [Guyanagaster necrorhizus MCA 3950]
MGSNSQAAVFPRKLPDFHTRTAQTTLDSFPLDPPSPTECVVRIGAASVLIDGIKAHRLPPQAYQFLVCVQAIDRGASTPHGAIMGAVSTLLINGNVRRGLGNVFRIQGGFLSLVLNPSGAVASAAGTVVVVVHVVPDTLFHSPSLVELLINVVYLTSTAKIWQRVRRSIETKKLPTMTDYPQLILSPSRSFHVLIGLSWSA